MADVYEVLPQFAELVRLREKLAGASAELIAAKDTLDLAQHEYFKASDAEEAMQKEIEAEITRLGLRGLKGLTARR